MPEFNAPITDLSRGKAASLLKKVHEEDNNLLIIKNSKPYAVVLSYKKYVDLIESK